MASPASTAAPAPEVPAAAADPAGSPAPASGADPPSASATAGSDALEVTVVPGITRYHRDDCILIRFLGAEDLERMSQADAEAADCVPCKACQPDKATSDS
jgi:hypothetical protein